MQQTCSPSFAYLCAPHYPTVYCRPHFRFRQKRQGVIIYREISMLAPFFSIACLQLAFPHVETVIKYIKNISASLCV